MERVSAGEEKYTGVGYVLYTYGGYMGFNSRAGMLYLYRIDTLIDTHHT